MNWDAAIERNREALKRILATLVAMAGPVVEGATLPRHLHRAVLRLLRPAEAAARRLVIVAARGMVVTLPPPRPRKVKPKPHSIFVRNGKGTGIVLPRGVRPSDILPALAPTRPRSLSLPLLDTLPKWPGSRRPRAAGIPRIWTPGISEPFRGRRSPLPDDPIDTMRLALRLRALGRALDDLPAHARRFARWRARRDAGLIRRTWPLRPGRPPGSRRRPTHEVHEVLKDLHYFAFCALERPDSS